MAEKEIKVSFCPKCKSTDVKYVFGFGNIFGVIPKMRCGKCGFEAQTFPLLVTNKKALDKSVTRKCVPSRKGTKVPFSSGKKKSVKKIKKKVKKGGRK